MEGTLVSDDLSKSGMLGYAGDTLSPILAHMEPRLATKADLLHLEGPILRGV